MAPLEIVPWLVLCIAMDVVSERCHRQGYLPASRTREGCCVGLGARHHCLRGGRHPDRARGRGERTLRAREGIEGTDAAGGSPVWSV